MRVFFVFVRVYGRGGLNKTFTRKILNKKERKPFVHMKDVFGEKENPLFAPSSFVSFICFLHKSLLNLILKEGTSLVKNSTTL